MTKRMTVKGKSTGFPCPYPESQGGTWDGQWLRNGVCGGVEDDVRETFFTLPVVRVWNSQPGSVVEVGCNEASQRAVDEYLNINNELGYEKKAGE